MQQHITQRSRAVHLDSLHQRRSRCNLLWNEQLAAVCPSGEIRHRDRPTDGSQRTVQRQFAGHQRIAKPTAGRFRQRSISRQHRQCDRQIQRRAFLAKIRRRKVDRDPTTWKHKAACRERTFDALYGFTYRGVGQTHDPNNIPTRPGHACFNSTRKCIDTLQNCTFDNRMHARLHASLER